MHKQTSEGVRKITVPAHKPIKRSTLAKLLADAELPIDEFLGLL